MFTPKEIILEPRGRNTGSAITIASLTAIKEYQNSNFLILSARS